MFIVNSSMIIDGVDMQTIDEQLTKVNDTTTKAQYLDFYNSNFGCGSTAKWPNSLKRAAPDNIFIETNPDYFRFLTLVGTLGCQFGYPSLEGQIYRHNKNKWQRSPFDPLHQLALACYIGNVNTESFPLKEQYAKEFQSNGNLVAAVGVWGLLAYVNNGHIEQENPFGSYDIRGDAEKRAKRSVFRPNQELNAMFAELSCKFNGTVADNIDPRTFKDDIYPEAERILGTIIDVESALLRPQQYRKLVSYFFNPSTLPLFNYDRRK